MFNITDIVYFDIESKSVLTFVSLSEQTKKTSHSRGLFGLLRARVERTQRASAGVHP